MSFLSPRSFRIVSIVVLMFASAAWAEAASRRRTARIETAAAVSLTGRITDAVSGAAVFEAMVSVQGKQAIADMNGNYRFSNLTAGSAAMEIQRWGYETRTNTVDLRSPSTSLNMTLQPRPIVTLTDTDGASYPVDYHLSQFQYQSSPLSSPMTLDPLPFCRADGTKVDTPKSDLRSVVGPAVVVTGHPCCPQGKSFRFTVTRKNGETFEGYLPECFYYHFSFQGRDRRNGRWLVLNLDKIARVDFPQ